jgi:inner membrane protein
MLSSVTIVLMQGKTHIAVGVATAILIVQPSTVAGGLFTCLGGAVGGLTCDLDIPSSVAGKELRQARRLLLALVMTIWVLDGWYGMGGAAVLRRALHSVLARDTAGLRVATGVVACALLSAYGYHTQHRTFMHSLCALAVFSYAVFLAVPSLAIPFAIGFASHIAADLCTYQDVRLFWPLRKGVSWGLVRSNGHANGLLCAASAIVMVVWLVRVLSPA